MKKRIVESHIVLGYNCNHRCKHCVVQIKRYKREKSYKDLSTNEAFEAIEIAILNGANKIVFSGGEPTLRKDLPELVLYCIKHNLDVQIQTNGSQTDIVKKICEQAKENLQRIEFMIPLHSSNSSENDYICECKGALEDTLRTLYYLQDMHARVIGKIVLTRYTGNLTDICNIYERVGAERVIIAYPHCVSFPNELVKKVDLAKENVVKIFDEFYSELHNIEIQLQAFPRCFIGDKDGIIIQEECPEYLNTMIVEFKFRSNSGSDWHEYRKLDKRKFTYCEKCKYDNYCEGIWKEYMRVIEP